MHQLCKYTAIYRCPDDVTNFKLRIKIGECPDDGKEPQDYVKQTFKWQQKIFSNAEREFYGDEKNCVTDLEKKYHSDLGNSAEIEKKIDLFSYINEDDFSLTNEIGNYSNYLERNLRLVSLNLVDEEDEESDGDYDLKKSILKNAKTPCHNQNNEVMFIMADLGSYIDTTWIKDERILCTLKFNHKKRILSIHPDFTTKEPYIIQIDNSCNKKYCYYIENISSVISEDESFKENELIKKLTNHKLAMRHHIAETPFILPPKNKIQVHLFFEILWAKQFEYNTIFIQYFIDLPPEWSCTDQSLLTGATQTNYGNEEESSAHFGHCFDIVLEYNLEELQRRGIPQCPYIYFEVISKDFWNRYRTEGLAYKNLPVSKPGTYCYELQCFRLLPQTVAGQLRRFFIGDCSNFNDITWIGVPRNHEDRILNKYGTNTLGTGQIGVRINVMHQSQAFLSIYNTETTMKSDEIFAKLNSSSLVKSVEQVLKAFRRARRNMLEVRKNI